MAPKPTTATRTIVVPEHIADAIRRHAAETYPNPCCGALVGGERAITGALRLPNETAEGPRGSSLVLPADFEAAQSYASETGAEVAGFYHSHPNHPARPSQHDLDHAWPFFVYLIVSVRKGKPGEMTAWRLCEDGSAFEPTLLQTGK